MTHKVGHLRHDVLTLSTQKFLPSKAQGHKRHFGGAHMTLVLSVIILADSPDRRGGVVGGQEGQESLKSCDDPRALSGVTGRPKSRAVV